MDTLYDLAGFDATQFSLVAMVIFCAGIVRGFTGFALSALIMATLASIIAPIELIPVCYFMELTASLVLVRRGLRDGDFKIAFGLALGSVLASPVGFYLTTTLPLDISKQIALLLILALASLQLFRIRPRFLASNPGLYLSGSLAGIATGLAAVGGMVVALYVLAREVPARLMRGSLVQYLAMTSIASAFYLYWFGMFTQVVLVRSALMVLPCLFGVLLGKALFTPRFETAYRPLCLTLLMALAGAGLLRLHGVL